MSAREPSRNAELALIFLRLGTTAFGGPAAHIAMMEEEFVRRRAWLTHEEFLDLVGAANLVPGPSSTEVAIHVGYRRAGWVGLILDGVCFILPAAILVSLFAWAYVRYGSLPSFTSALYGIKPVVVAIVGQAIWNLGIKVIDTWIKRGLIVVSGVASWFGISPLFIIFGAGILASVFDFKRGMSLKSELPLLRLLATIAAIAFIPLCWELIIHGKPHADPL